MASLFSPYTLKAVTLRNRIVASPMCHGHGRGAQEWHQTHYSTLAKGGVGLVIVEADSVARRANYAW